MASTVIFYIVAALVIFTALKMVLSTNLVHSTLFMAATFAGIAVVFILLNADYLAIVQIMIYVGAISVLFVFGVMLTKRTNMGESSKFSRYKLYGGIVAAGMFLIFAGTIFTMKYVPVNAAAPKSTISAVSYLLFNDDSVIFEATGILLLVATIGATVVGRGVKESK